MTDFESGSNPGGVDTGAAQPQAAAVHEVNPGAQNQPDAALREQATAEYHRLRDKAVGKTATASDLQAYKQYGDFLFDGGKLPEAMRPAPMSLDPNEGHDGLEKQAASLYEPAFDKSDYKSEAETAKTVPPEAIDAFKDFAHKLQLPPHLGGQVVDRLAHHIEHGPVEPLDDDAQQVYWTEALRYFGGDQKKMERTMIKAEEYVARTLPRDQATFVLQLFDSSLGFDPWLMTHLATAFDAKGWTLPSKQKRE